jgi:large repetitive protein
MKTFFTRLLMLLSVLATGLFGQTASGQTGVLNPLDTIVIYNPSAPPALPPSNTLAKWVKTNRMSYNTDEMKCYIYNGLQFRLKFPKSYQPGADGKVYPMYVFFHGVGEAGTIYDNEYQLYHGGQIHLNAVDNGTFDGFLFYPQSSAASGGWSQAQINTVYTLIMNYFIPQIKVDPNRVVVNGLSGGGSGAWLLMETYPKLAAAVLPMSAASIGDEPFASALQYVPIWLFQGGLDLAPAPFTTAQLVASFTNIGADMTYTLFTTQAHDTWDSTWEEPNYFPFLLNAFKSNPWPLTGRTQFCPTDSINVTMGVTAGFDGYQWSNNGVVIPTATTNTLVVKALGTYACRILRGTVWSPWSPTPVVISTKTATVTPNIQVSGLASDVLPAPDGSTSVSLQVPPGYASYVWERVDSPAILATTVYLLNNATPGVYAAKVTEQFGCSSSFSNPFTVIKAGGPNAPTPPSSLTGAALSQTQVKLNWSENPNPPNLETQFEIYQATASAGPYKLIGFSPALVDTFLSKGLNAKTTYYFQVRAINNTAASASTSPISVATQADTVAPTAPANLRTGTVASTSVQLIWDSATDNVGVTNYDIYVNGQKSYSVGDVGSFTVYNLAEKQSYIFAVKARDLAGNVSPFSNQITSIAAFNGLTYNYYSGIWNTIPDFNSLTPTTSGNVTNVTLTPALSDVDFGFLWTGTINIPVTGTYTFQTASDDGSKLYIDTTYRLNAGSTVNNDGLHGTVTVTSAPLTLTAGPHKFTATYIQQGGGFNMAVNWKTPQTAGQFTAIPDSAFVEKVTPAGSAPAAPSGLTAVAASFKLVNLNWTNNGSISRTSTEIFRSTTPAAGTFVNLGRAQANATSFADSTALPATTYYYEVEAINQYGSSKFNGQDSAALTYNYYETGSLSVLPNFSTLTPTSTGMTTSIDVTIPNRGSQWAATYTGFINIPVTGNYTFYTSSDDGSAMYIDGHLVVNNDGLHGTQEVSGTLNNLAAGPHAIQVQYFQNGGGQVLTASIAGPGLTKEIIPATMLGKPPVSVTTLGLPGSPVTPSAFTVTAPGTKKVLVTWKDSATVANNYNLYRSLNTNANFLLLAKLTAGNGSFSYVDTTVFPNSKYYYELDATNVGGNSPFTSQLNVTTPDSLPVIAPVGNRSMRYATTMALNISSTSPVGDPLSVVFTGLPAFAIPVSTGNGQATLTFNPQQSDSGTYTITITATDQHGGVTASSFNLWVNNIYNPVISGITGVTVAEGATGSLVLTAADQNTGDSVRWRFSKMPSFVTPVINASTVTLQMNPGYAAQGVYAVAAIAYGGVGGVDSENFTITVTQVNPNKTYYIAFNNGSKLATGFWNNTAKAVPTLNDVYGTFKDSLGGTSNLGIKVTSSWQAIGTGSNTEGATTGNNSGVYPDVVTTQAYWTTSTAPQTFNITGLDTSKNRTYTLTFFGSRGSVTDNRTSVYTVGTSSVSLNAASNTKNTVSLAGIKPSAAGIITVSLKAGTGSSYAYLNAMVIQNIFNDSTAPAAPVSFAAALSPSNIAALLTWTPVAYNETGYQVYRSTNPAGPFTLIKTTPAKAAGYNDSTIVGNVTYYYEVNAVNTIGTSAFTPVVQLIVPDKAPVFAVIGNQSVKGDTTVAVPVSVTITPGDNVALTAQGLPSFASFTDNGNGHGVLTIAPSNSQVGIYKNVTITATDNFGGVASSTISITVKNKLLTSTYINFNQTLPVSFPWNNFNSNAVVGAAINNLTDENNSVSGAKISLLESWGGASAVGDTTGNNSGIFPDSVMETTYFDNSGVTKHIKLTGLQAGNQYNLVFFASRIATDTRITYYSVGTDTVSLNVSNNTTTTVQLNGLTPDSTGSITVSVNKASAAPYAYINAMVIQAYTASSVPIPPASLTALGTSKSSVVLKWSDRSSNETAFEVWRADVSPGSTNLTDTFALIGSVATNVVTYTDNTVQSGSNYAYEVRAKAGSLFSGYTNIAYAGALNFSVYMNFNRILPLEPQWNNNTNNAPNQGAVFPNLLNDMNNPTGMNLTVVNNFSGDNTLGVNTGNNSGIYPDDIMDKAWWVDAGTTATIEINGLNQAMTYNFVFFGSRAATDVVDRTTIYSIGSRTANLNATNNSTQTTQINQVTPDSNGAVFINITHASTSSYGYLSAMVIQAANSFNAPVVLVSADKLHQGAGFGFDDSTAALNSVTAYPNPIIDDLRLKFTLNKQTDKLGLRVLNSKGGVVFLKELSNLPQGTSYSQMGLNAASLSAGVYFVEVYGFADGRVRTITIVKR